MDVLPVLCGIGRELIWKGSLLSEVHAADNQIGEGATMRGGGGGGGGGSGLDPSVKTGRGWRGGGIISFLSSGPFPFANLAFVRRPHAGLLPRLIKSCILMRDSIQTPKGPPPPLATTNQRRWKLPNI